MPSKSRTPPLNLDHDEPQQLATYSRTWRLELIAQASCVLFFILFGTHQAKSLRAFLFILGMCLPYLVLFLISSSLRRRNATAIYAKGSLAITLLVLLFTLLVLLDAFVFSVSSTSALVLLFVPIWSLVGGGILLLIWAALSRRLQQPR